MAKLRLKTSAAPASPPAGYAVLYAGADGLLHVVDAAGHDVVLQTSGDGLAPLASPSFTGTPAAPTAAADTSTTQLATTQFVMGQAGTAAPLMDGTATVGSSKRYARADHVHPTDTSRQAASPVLTQLAASGAGLRNLVINGGCQVIHRAPKNLSNAWASGEVSLIAVKAEGAVSAGTIRQASGVTALSVGGFAAQVQTATLGISGAVWFRHRIEARDAVRLRNSAAILSLRVWHDVGSAVTWTVTVNKATATDDFAAVTQIATGTTSIASATNADQVLAVADMGDCANGIELLVKADCGAVTGKSFTLSDLQLEPGTGKTPFERRPVALEQRLVERFLRKVEIGLAKANSASNLQAAFHHRGMRAAPAYEATGPLAFTDCVVADFTQSVADINTVHERTADGGRASCGLFSGLTSGTVMMALTSGGAVLASAELV